MQFHERYLDVLQNIESAIMEIYEQHPDLIDYDVSQSLEATINFYSAQKDHRPPRKFNLSPIALEIAVVVQEVCDWRLGRRSAPGIEAHEEPIEVPPITPEEIIACLKKIHKSVQFWTKQSGRQGYLKYISIFM